MSNAIYLAHMNPLTKSHEEIIRELRAQGSDIFIMPVIFMKKDTEVNSRSFPFNFEIRKKMIQAVFGDSVIISNKYTFFAPFFKYLPPLLSPFSWGLRRKIRQGMNHDYFTYTGDKAEGYMLKAYNLHPKIGNRKMISAKSTKDKIYKSILEKQDTDWQNDVSAKVQDVIKENWHVLEKFAYRQDATCRVLGMKFPKDGYWYV